MKQTNKVLGMILFMILIVGMFGTVSAVNVYQTIAPYQATSGHLYVTVLCQHNLFSKDMVLVNDIAPNVNTTISLGPNGRFDGMFVAGNYTLTLLDGNAGHPETKKFTIRNGYEQHVTFIGHAVTFDHVECELGDSLVNGKCVPIECDTGMSMNRTSGVCEPIVCPVGTQLNGNSCDPIVCPIGERLVEGQCSPIICDTGFSLNQTSGICDPIVCPVGTQLVGNDCEPIVCPVGEELIGNDCTPIVCESGYHLVGNECVIDECNPIVSILSAFYGAKGACHTVVDVPAHNETVIDVFNHTEYQILTYQIVTPAVPISYKGEFKKLGGSDNYQFVGVNSADYNVTFVGHTSSTTYEVGYFSQHDGHCYPVIGDNYDFIVDHVKYHFTDNKYALRYKSTTIVNYLGDTQQDGDSNNYKYVGANKGDYLLSKPGHVDGTDAVYGFVVTTPFTDGYCPSTIACVPQPGDTKCEEKLVPDTFKEITVPDTFKTVCDPDTFVDVTEKVQSVVNGGDFSFSFNNAPNPGGIFATNGTLLNPIADPIYGTVKTATIKYSVSCGGVQNAEVSGSEGVILTLDTSVVA